MLKKRGIAGSSIFRPRQRKSQAAMEYLMVAGIAFMIVIPMMYILYQYTSSVGQDVSESKVNKIGTDLANTAEQIFYLGPPSRTTLRFDMPEGIYDMEVLGDKTLVFKTSDPASPKEVSVFTNVEIVSYLLPEDFSKGKKNVKVEAESDHVSLYTGDKATAMRKSAAYGMFKIFMEKSKIVYSEEDLVKAVSDNPATGIMEYSLESRDAKEIAYVSGSMPGSVDISAEIKIGELDGPIHFFVGKIAPAEIGTGYDTTFTLDIEMDSTAEAHTGIFLFSYGGTSLDPNIGGNTVFDKGKTYRLNITRSLGSDCNVKLCPGGDPTHYYYLFIVYDLAAPEIVKTSAYIDESSMPAGLPMSNWVLGDVSSVFTYTKTTAWVNKNVMGAPSPGELKSTDITYSMNIPIDFKYIKTEGGKFIFNITYVEGDGTPENPFVEKSTMASFNSYYPVSGLSAGTYAMGSTCEFNFAKTATGVVITKTGDCTTPSPPQS